MLEIEMKFPVDQFTAIQAKLESWGAKLQPAIEESDHYFNAPDRDFAQTDEAFRLRSIGETNRITYKGPKQGGPTKTRTEVEIAIEPGHDAAKKYCQLVQLLGYRPTTIVQKRRTCFEFTRDQFALQARFDEVQSVGRYVEIEIVAESAERARAEAVLLQVAEELGLTKSEPRSYLEMVLAKQNA